MNEKGFKVKISYIEELDRTPILLRNITKIHYNFAKGDIYTPGIRIGFKSSIHDDVYDLYANGIDKFSISQEVEISENFIEKTDKVFEEEKPTYTEKSSVLVNGRMRPIVGEIGDIADSRGNRNIIIYEATSDSGLRYSDYNVDWGTTFGLDPNKFYYTIDIRTLRDGQLVGKRKNDIFGMKTTIILKKELERRNIVLRNLDYILYNSSNEYEEGGIRILLKSYSIPSLTEFFYINHIDEIMIESETLEHTERITSPDEINEDRPPSGLYAGKKINLSSGISGIIKTVSDRILIEDVPRNFGWKGSDAATEDIESNRIDLEKFYYWTEVNQIDKWDLI